MSEEIAARFNYVKLVNEKYNIPQKLWDNAEKFTDLHYEIRNGYRITNVYRDEETGSDISAHMLAFDVKNDASIPDEERKFKRKQKIILRHPESVMDHSARVANTMSEVMFAYPKLFQKYNQAAIMKVALCHDVGEATVHDIPDDGSEEHALKEVAEAKAVDEYYSPIFDPIHSTIVSYHRQFEKLDTFLGQMIKMIDKVDAIARLIMFERYDIYGNVYDKKPPSKQDIRFAKEIGTGNCTDVWARRLYQLFYEEYHFDSAITKIAEDFLYAGTQSVGRPWFTFWPRT